MFQINKMPEKIDIGIIGETNFRTHKFDMSPWMQDTPDGVPSIIVIRPEETEADAYIAATEFDRETNVLSWTITAGDLGEVAGEGVMRIWLEEEDNEETIVKRGKSVKVTTIINEDETRDPSDEPPEAQEAWMEQMTALKVATVDAAADADDAKDDAEAAAALAEGSAEDAEAYAIGKRNGEDVTSGDPAYHNNSKYYAIKAWEHAGDAENAKIDAVAAKNAAVGAKNDAVSAKNDAVSAKNDAVTAQGAAEYAQGKAEDAQDAAEDAQTAAENAQGAAEGSAKDAEAWAVGERGGVPVTSGDDTYENNAKYYAEEAASTLANKADKADTVLTTTLSRGRKSGTTVGTGSFAFGDNVEASGYMSFAKGALTKASGADASAEGSAAFAEGQASHAEGRSTIASGKASHSEGQQTTASGDNSHAEGYLTTAEGNQSHAEGEYTKATHAAQHVFGAYNALDTSTNDSDAHGNFIEIVGNGFNSSNKRNARTLSWLGDERLLGNLFVGANANGTGGHKVARADTTAVQGNFAMFDNGGNPVDSGHKHSDYLTEHQDISGKADKVTGATNGNLAGLDGNGNLTDSGKKASDFVEGDDFYATEMPMSSLDSTKVSAAIGDLKSQIDGKAPIIFDTVQNVPIASVSDATVAPVKSLIIGIEPIQAGSGDPYPGGASPQRWDEQWESGSLNQSGNNSTDATRIRSTNYIPVESETEYYFKSAVGKTLGLRWYDTDKVCISSANTTVQNNKVTSPEGAKYLRFTVVDTTTYGNDISINYPSTDHDYHKWANDRPITGWDAVVVTRTGGNLYNPSLMEKGYVNATAQRPRVLFSKAGTYYINALKTGESSGTVYYIIKNADGTYGTGYAVVNGTTVNKRTVTITDGQELIVYGGASSSATVADVQAIFADWGVVVSPQDMTTYETYTGQTHTADLPSTVYGGQIDWVGGQADSDLALAVFVGSADEDWRINEYTNQNRVSILLNDAKAERDINVLANYLKAPSTFKSSPDEWEFNVNEYKYLLIGVPKTIDTVAKWKTYLASNNLQVLYHLDTPTTISLSVDEIRTVEGQNNLWADCGDIVELTYACDTKGYIEKRLAELQALILENN